MLIKTGKIRKFGIFILGVILFCSVSYALAEEVSFEASVDSNRVSLGQSIQLTLTVRGAKGTKPFKLPPIDGFDVRYLGPSTRVSIINGQYSSSVAYIYLLVPLKVGKFQIPAFRVTINGKQYTSKPIDIEVVSAASPQGPPQQTASPALTLSDRIFVTIKTPKKEVYVNERVPLTIKLYVNGFSVRDIQLPTLEANGFTMEDYQKPKQYSELLGGVRYNVVEFDTYIYPMRPGEIVLGPAKISLDVLLKNRQKQSSLFPFGDMDSFFNDDFFNNFFETYQRYPFVAKSADLQLNVKPLPQEGKPETFSGAVGNFDFQVSVGPTEVSVGDPITVTMKVSGEGNFQTVQFPSFKENADFKVYQPEIKAKSGEKTCQQVLIPRHDRISQIPPVSFSYFNPQDGKYHTLRKGPFPIKVHSVQQSQAYKVVPSPSQPIISVPKEETLGEDILFIKEELPSWTTMEKALGIPVFFWIIMGGLVLANGGFLGYYLYQKKISSDEGYARQVQISKKSKEILKEAHYLLCSDKQKDYYNALFKALQGYLAAKFYKPVASLTLDEIIQLGKERDIDSSIMGKIQTVWHRCEEVRFSPTIISEEEMKRDFNDVKTIIQYLEKH